MMDIDKVEGVKARHAFTYTGHITQLCLEQVFFIIRFAKHRGKGIFCKTCFLNQVCTFKGFILYLYVKHVSK